MAAGGGINMGQLAVDEFGNPFILMEGQQGKTRLKGIEAHKSNILAAKAIAETIRSSLGPKGMDKILVGPDGDITVTNDGATILEKMDVDHEVAKLLVDLSRSQDNEIGDGTTGIVVLAGALLDQSLALLDKGIHPLRIASGFEKACDVAVTRVQEIANELNLESSEGLEFLNKVAMTALGSKIVSSKQTHFAKICVDAVTSVADMCRKDVIFDLIKVEGKVGGKLEDTCLIEGIVVDKTFSHPQMSKTVKDAKMAILTCPFEPPKPKTKHKLDIRSASDYKKLHEQEQQYFRDQIKLIKDAGANLAICQWGFDDEANHLLYQEGLHAIRWMGGVELELIAIATNGRIVPRFEELSNEKLGTAGMVHELALGTMGDNMLVIKECGTKTVTILVRGGNQMVVDEAKRCIHDANCCVRNMIRDSRICPGGGASEMAASLAIAQAAEKIGSLDQYSMSAFAEALDSIGVVLAENSGLNAIACVAESKAKQQKEKNAWHGIDCVQAGTTNMWDQRVFESCAAKVNQLRLATQVVKMILKIDDVISQSEAVDG